ncbi:MAG: hypothetical protein EHM65_11885, partial [Acidobacteriales bacterium]
MHTTLRRGILVLLPLACLGVARGQDSDPRGLEARLLGSPPVIDGSLNDEAWQVPPLNLGPWLTYN